MQPSLDSPEQVSSIAAEKNSRGVIASSDPSHFRSARLPFQNHPSNMSAGLAILLEPGVGVLSHASKPSRDIGIRVAIRKVSDMTGPSPAR
ncbi:hypothetical protein [Streptomyces sp. NPDC002491]